jgi:hypothetical protein
VPRKIRLEPFNADLVRDLEDLQKIIANRSDWTIEQYESMMQDLDNFLPDLLAAMKQYRKLN